MKKAIIFDLDGTLWDTSKETQRIWSEVARNYELKNHNYNVNDVMGMTKEEIIETLFKNDRKLGNSFITECQKKENEYFSKKGGHIYSNVLETIYDLYNRIELYIVSNCQSGYIESFLHYYKLEKYFKDYECSGNTGEEKSENIKRILQRNNISFAVYVGDTEKDYYASKINNLPFIWASYGFGLCEKYDVCINNIVELRKIQDFNINY